MKVDIVAQDWECGKMMVGPQKKACKWRHYMTTQLRCYMTSLYDVTNAVKDDVTIA